LYSPYSNNVMMGTENYMVEKKFTVKRTLQMVEINQPVTSDFVNEKISTGTVCILSIWDRLTGYHNNDTNQGLNRKGKMYKLIAVSSYYRISVVFLLFFFARTEIFGISREGNFVQKRIIPSQNPLHSYLFLVVATFR